MLKTYPAIFHKDDTSYWVEFPDFGGGTDGVDLNDAMKNAREMLEGVTAFYIDEDIPLPEPSDITKLGVSDGFVFMIQVDPTPFVINSKAVRKNVTVPGWVG